MKFVEFGLNEEVLEAISLIGFEEATPIQEKSLPLIMAGQDIIGCAQTGTGKTAAFLLPVLHKLLEDKSPGLKVLVLVPTRELAIQIDQFLEGITYNMDITSLSIYGGGDGSSWKYQKETLQGGADIIVATPGKLISHLNLGYVDFSSIKYLILDEADRMLDIGFHDDLMKIISFLPTKRQSLLFSATMPNKIKQLAKKILKDPKEISIAISKPAEGVLQVAYLCYERQKIPIIESLIKGKDEVESIIIFCSTKKSVSEVERAIRKINLPVKSISSDLEQSEREKVMQLFRAKNVRVLVATDVISRGIDIKGISLVINYNVPRDPEDYVHRVGRTARADATGVAITLINDEEMSYFQKIEKLIERSITKVQPPPALGQGPKWDPNAKRPSRGGGRNFRKPGRSKTKRKS
jgi:superfamily II DNA/RNA helicase